MKLQPNFSWQKYQGKEENQKEQFQFQLQQQHIVTANSINATIDDESFFTRERQTAFTWVDNRAIWTKTIIGVIIGAVGTSTNYAHGISNIKEVVRVSGSAQDADPMAVFGLPLPYVDPITAANGIGIFVSPTNVTISTNSVTWNNYLFNVTIYYTKIKV